MEERVDIRKEGREASVDNEDRKPQLLEYSTHTHTQLLYITGTLSIATMQL